LLIAQLVVFRPEPGALEQKSFPVTRPAPQSSPSFKKTLDGDEVRATHPRGSSPLNVIMQPTGYGAASGHVA
jgi:hypothetical protein